MPRIRPFFVLAVLLVAVLLRPDPARAFCFPVYGNWCGDDWPPADRPRPRPVDPFDAACMRHDMCYAQTGEGDTRCDRGFVAELNQLRWQYGGLPRPLELAEAYFRTKSGGPLRPPPIPMPDQMMGDMLGVARGLLADCE